MVAALDRAGNASSVHAEGREARRLIERARGEVAALVGADRRNVTFVSGGSEANVTVLAPDLVVGGKPQRVDRLLVGATEHPSVLSGGRFAKDQVTEFPVDEAGHRPARRAGGALASAAEAGETGARLGHARQQRDRDDPAGREDRRNRPPPRCLCPHRCRPGRRPYPDRYRSPRRRFPYPVQPQDRWAAGRRCHGPAQRGHRLRAADHRWRPGVSPPRRNGERCRDRRLRRRGGRGRCASLPRPAAGTAWRDRLAASVARLGQVHHLF